MCVHKWAVNKRLGVHGGVGEGRVGLQWSPCRPCPHPHPRVSVHPPTSARQGRTSPLRHTPNGTVGRGRTRQDSESLVVNRQGSPSLLRDPWLQTVGLRRGLPDPSGPTSGLFWAGRDRNPTGRLLGRPVLTGSRPTLPVSLTFSPPSPTVEGGTRLLQVPTSPEVTPSPNPNPRCASLWDPRPSSGYKVDSSGRVRVGPPSWSTARFVVYRRRTRGLGPEGVHQEESTGFGSESVEGRGV